MAEAVEEISRRRVPRLTAILAEIGAGLSGGAVTASGCIPDGLIAFAPLGPAVAGVGAVLALLGGAFGGAVFVAMRRTRGLMASSSTQASLVVASALASLQGAGVIPHGADGLPMAMAATGVMTFVSGLVVLLLSVTGLSGVVPMIPFPVIAGLRNAAALLLARSQWSSLAGVHFSAGGAPAWAHPLAPLIGGATLLLILRPPPGLRALPPMLLAMFVGGVLHFGLAALLPPARADAWVGPLVGGIPDWNGYVAALFRGWSVLPELLAGPALPTLLAAGLSIAILVATVTLVCASSMQDLSGESAPANRDLLAIGAANAGAGLAACVPACGGFATTIAIWRHGGRERLSGLVDAALLLAIVVALPSALALLPLSAVAAAVLAVAWMMVDREGLALLRGALRRRPGQGEVLGGAAVSMLVIVVAAFANMTAAVLAGTALALLLFVLAMARSGIRRVQVGPIGRSRTRRSALATEALMRHAAEIVVIELQGALFFGSVNQVAERIDAATAAGARSVIVDFKHVGRIDFSGLRRLVQLAARWRGAGCRLVFSSIRPESELERQLAALLDPGRLEGVATFAALEDALDRAEAELLDRRAPERANAPRSPFEALRAFGLPAERIAALLAYTHVRQFRAGEPIIRAGERATDVYLLLDGDADVMLPAPAEGSGDRVRLATMSRDTMAGELALITQAPRSADLIARTNVSCLVFAIADIEELRRNAPDVAYDLLHVIALQIARNLHVANAALQALSA